MNTVIWILQIFIAFTFMYSGVCKFMFPLTRLVAMGQTGVEHLPLWFVRFIGVAEIFGTVGLILPWLLWIYPVFTPIAALCFAFIMPFAAVIHYKRKEPKNVVLNIVLMSICLLIAIIRFKGLNAGY